MRPKVLPIALTALIAAVTLASGVSTAAAADEFKPTLREISKTPAVDADISPAPARIEEEGSALGSYWDPERPSWSSPSGPTATSARPRPRSSSAARSGSSD